MKKSSFIVALMLCVLVLAGCRQEEVMHLGLDAEVVEVDAERETIRVKNTGEDGLFGAGCLLDCGTAVESHQVLYCNYESGEVWEIALEDLQAGDRLSLECVKRSLRRSRTEKPASVRFSWGLSA